MELCRVWTEISVCLNSLAVLLISFWFAFLFGLVVVAALDGGTVFFFFIEITFTVVNTGAVISFSRHQDAVCGFLFQFLTASEAKSSQGYLQPFSGAMRGINQEGENARTPPFSLPRISWFVFRHISSPTSPVASLLLLPSVSVVVCRCLSLRPSVMYYKQACFWPDPHTHTSRLSLRFTILLHFSQNLIKGAPFIPVKMSWWDTEPQELVVTHSLGKKSHSSTRFY